MQGSTYMEFLSEDQEQKKVVSWLRANGIKFYHIPNGGTRNLIEAVNFKKLGVSPGVPDLCIPYARKGYHTLYIEMKKKKGGIVSDHQKSWIEFLISEGMKAIICRGAEEAILEIEKYFK